VPIQDLLEDALFVAALSPPCLPAGSSLNRQVLALAREALSRVPSLVAHAGALGEWTPLLKVDRGDELADRAALVLKSLLETCRIKSEVRANPWMSDRSKYLFVDTQSLAAAAALKGS